jgi:hypothetical protein
VPFDAEAARIYGRVSPAVIASGSLDAHCPRDPPRHPARADVRAAVMADWVSSWICVTAERLLSYADEGAAA